MTTTATKTTTTAPLNRGVNDWITDDGVRISLPLYVDPPHHLRKQAFSALRAKIESRNQISNPESISGLSVSTAMSGGNDVEGFVGITMDNLRHTMFSRGGLDASLLLRIQAVTGVQLCSAADIEKAMKARIKQVKDFVAANRFE